MLMLKKKVLVLPPPPPPPLTTKVTFLAVVVVFVANQSAHFHNAGIFLFLSLTTHVDIEKIIQFFYSFRV